MGRLSLALGTSGTYAASMASSAADASAVASFASKAAAREFVGGMGLSDAQLAAVNRAIGRATSSSSIYVLQGESGSVIVRIARPGANGYQIMESTVAADGSKTVVQKAFDAAGRMVHYDPKVY